MKKINPSDEPSRRRTWPLASAAGLALAFAVSVPAAHAEQITLPGMPDNLQVTDGSTPFRVGHAIGTQNYICLPSGSGFAWTLFTPEATLFNDHHKQLITHLFSVNPDEDGNVIRATWQDSRDTSIVWAKVATNGSSTDQKFVAVGAVPWLLLDAVGVQEGPTGGDTLSVASHVQRLSTQGGVAPATGCAQASDVGSKAFMPYTADYFFYRLPGSDDDDHDHDGDHDGDHDHDRY